MNSLPIGEKYNAQISIFHLRRLNPSPDPTISLNRFSDRCSDRSFDPRLLDDRPIWADANRFEIERELHSLDKFNRIDPCCRITCCSAAGCDDGCSGAMPMSAASHLLGVTYVSLRSRSEFGYLAIVVFMK